MAKIYGKFAVKLNGKIYKAISITRSKDCIVLSYPDIAYPHITYPKNGDIHFTIENSGYSDTSQIEKDCRVSKRDNKTRIYFVDKKFIKNDTTFDNVTIKNLGTHGISKKNECLYVPNKYELINVDAFNCKSLNMQTYITAPNQDAVNKVPISHRGETKIVKFNDVWVVIKFIDSNQPI
jgi:hypothetical protein